MPMTQAPAPVAVASVLAWPQRKAGCAGRHEGARRAGRETNMSPNLARLGTGDWLAPIELRLEKCL